jgi:Uma2 family endonuclease
MATTTMMSLAEFERLEQGPDQIELLKGELVRMPPPQRAHMEIARRLFKLLDPAVEGRLREQPAINLGTVFFEMGYLLSRNPASWLRPDVSLNHPDQEGDRYFTGAPLIVFEVVSESDTAPQLDEKVSEYLAGGAGEVWLIYPNRRHAWVYDGSASARHETSAIRSALLPGIEIPLDQIF